IFCNNKLEGPLPNITGTSSLKYLDLSSDAFDSTDFSQWLLTMKNLTTLRRTCLDKYLLISLAFPLCNM
ncbi:hypothetical protein S245_012790, partial [Arachis hypogaea]